MTIDHPFQNDVENETSYDCDHCGTNKYGEYGREYWVVREVSFGTSNCIYALSCGENPYPVSAMLLFFKV